MGRFLLIWLAVALGLGVAITTVDWIVDPFGILDMPRWPDLTARKVSGAAWPRLTKPYLVEAVDPATLIMGSSNADVGINPDGPAWPNAARPAFNLAIDGAGPGSQADFLRHALVRTHPHLVLIGVSFEDAFVMPPVAGQRASAADIAQYSYMSRLRVTADGKPNPDYPLGRLQDVAFALFSFDALLSSWNTLLYQNGTDTSYQTRSGWNSGGAFLRWARSEGWYDLAMDKTREKARQFVNWSRHPVLSVAPVAEMVRLARARGAEPIVFIMPGYIDKLEIFRQVGLLARMDAWKAELVADVDRAAGPTPVTIWDFSGVSRYITEPLPRPGDRSTEMRWIWEAVHFRAALGDMMVARMLAAQGPEDLGVRIDSGTLAQQAAIDRAAQATWVATHPADVARIADVLAEVSQKICGTPLVDCIGPPAP